jgi:hypothetical protein
VPYGPSLKKGNTKRKCHSCQRSESLNLVQCSSCNKEFFCFDCIRDRFVVLITFICCVLFLCSTSVLVYACLELLCCAEFLTWLEFSSCVVGYLTFDCLGLRDSYVLLFFWGMQKLEF